MDGFHDAGQFSECQGHAQNCKGGAQYRKRPDTADCEAQIILQRLRNAQEH